MTAMSSEETPVPVDNNNSRKNDMATQQNLKSDGRIRLFQEMNKY